MFFKISILLLSIILAANIALGQSDDEILKKSYENCREWTKKAENELISLYDFWLYMGKNDGDYFRIITYFDDKPLDKLLKGIIKFITGKRDEPEGLDLKNFRILFKEICKERCVSVKHWAASREKLAATRTLEATKFIQPAETDDGAFASNTELDEHEKAVLEISFNDCRKWSGVSENSNIGISHFCCYMGLKNNDTILNDFFKNNSYALFRMREYYVANPDLAQGPVDVKLYSQMFKYMCDKNSADVSAVVKYRISQAAKRSLHQFLMLPPEERD